MTGKEIAATGGVTTYITLDKGERIWVTGNRMDSGVRETALDDAEDKCSGSSCYFPGEESNTGETLRHPAAHAVKSSEGGRSTWKGSSFVMTTSPYRQLYSRQRRGTFHRNLYLGWQCGIGGS